MIGLRNGVVFVIMAIGAGDRQAQKGRAGGIGEIGHELIPPALIFLENAARTVVLTEAHIARRRNFIYLGLRLRLVRTGHLIPGKLLLNKLVVRLVLIERADHVIAVAIGIGPELIALKAIRVGVADDVQPVPSPSLAVMRAGKQPIDKFLVSIRRVVGEKRFDLFGRGRQPDQIEIQAAYQRSAIPLREGFNPLASRPARIKRSTGVLIQAGL